MRRKIVAGNWKMNKTISEAVELAIGLHEFAADFPKDVEVIIAPPALFLANLEMLKHPSYTLSAQNCSHHDFGAFTGEISPAMLADMNIPYCIIGHSERRQYFHETHDVLQKKVDACFRNKIKPIFCCGEVLEERNEGIHFDTVLKQLEESLFHLDKEQIKNTVIAYEPVWAIGTGVTASNDQAQEMHAFIRESLANQYGAPTADEITILYGGSVNATNAGDLFSCPDVDGGLVGGASLKAKDFATIIAAAK